MRRRHLRAGFLALLGLAGVQATTLPRDAQGEVQGQIVPGQTNPGYSGLEPPPFEPSPQPAIARAALPGDSSQGPLGAGGTGGAGGAEFPPSPPSAPGAGGSSPVPPPLGFGGQGGVGGGAVPIANLR